MKCVHVRCGEAYTDRGLLEASEFCIPVFAAKGGRADAKAVRNGAKDITLSSTMPSITPSYKTSTLSCAP